MRRSPPALHTSAYADPRTPTPPGPQWGATPLHKAAEKGRHLCAEALLLLPPASAAAASAATTTTAAADANARCDDGMTPAHLAALHAHRECLLSLLELGAAPDAPNAVRARPPARPLSLQLHLHSHLSPHSASYEPG